MGTYVFHYYEPSLIRRYMIINQYRINCYSSIMFPFVQVVSARFPNVMVSKAIFKESSSSNIEALTRTRSSMDGCSCPATGSLSITFLPGDRAPSIPHSVLLSTGCGLTSHYSQKLSPCSQNVSEVDAFLQRCVSVQLHGSLYPQVFLKPAETAENIGFIELTAPGWRENQALQNTPQDFIINFC